MSLEKKNPFKVPHLRLLTPQEFEKQLTYKGEMCDNYHYVYDMYQRAVSVLRAMGTLEVQSGQEYRECAKHTYEFLKQREKGPQQPEADPETPLPPD